MLVYLTLFKNRYIVLISMGT